VTEPSILIFGIDLSMKLWMIRKLKFSGWTHWVSKLIS